MVKQMQSNLFKAFFTELFSAVLAELLSDFVSGSSPSQTTSVTEATRIR